MLGLYDSDFRNAYEYYSNNNNLDMAAFIDKEWEYDLKKLAPERQKVIKKLIQYTAKVWDEHGILPYLESKDIAKAAYQKWLERLPISDAGKKLSTQWFFLWSFYYRDVL